MTYRAVVSAVNKDTQGKRNVTVDFQFMKVTPPTIEDKITYSNVTSLADLQSRVALRLQELLDRYEDTQGAQQYLGKVVGTI